MTLIFDRGFRRVSLVRALTLMDFHFVIRCCDQTWIKGKTYSGMIDDLPHLRGKVLDLGVVRATRGRLPPKKNVTIK